MNAIPQLTTRIPDLVIVTGTASGLGRNIVRLLAASGAQVIGVDLVPVPEEFGASYTHIQGDVSRSELWQQVIAEVEARQPQRLGLVSAAAVLRVGTIDVFSPADTALTMNVNFLGTLLAMQAVLPVMRSLGGGPIVAVASIDATFAEQQLAVYAASKGAVRQLTRTVAMDHARDGIRANVLSPGPMMAGLFERHMQSANDPEKFLAARAARQPGGRILDPAEIAQCALFLLSDASSALNGTEIIADGGLTTSFDFRTGAEGASV